MEEYNDESATKNSDYFDMGQVGSDQEQKDKGTPITPITKYVELSSKMLIELRNHKVNQVSENSGNDDNDDDNCISRNVSSVNLNHVPEDDERSKKSQHESKEVLGTTDKKKLSSINVKVIKPSNGANFNDYLKNVRSNMTHPRANSVRLKHTSNTDHNALAESGVDYGSPGSFQDRAKAFSKIPNATPLRGGRQVRRGKSNMKML